MILTPKGGLYNYGRKYKQEQEIIVQTEIISHMKQPVPGLDSKEVRKAKEELFQKCKSQIMKL